MAEDNKLDVESAKKVRRLRTGPAETVRQQAEKAQAKQDQPEKPRRISGTAKAVGRPLKKVFRPFRFLRFLIPKYFRNSWQELRLVTWPDRKKTLRLTTAVIIFSVIFGLVVAALDFVLDKLFRQLLV